MLLVRVSIVAEEVVAHNGKEEHEDEEEEEEVEDRCAEGLDERLDKHLEPLEEGDGAKCAQGPQRWRAGQVEEDMYTTACQLCTRQPSIHDRHL